MRTVMVLVAGLALLTACGGPAREPVTPATPAPEPTAAPEPAPEARIGTINLDCGGETFRVAFLDTHAAIFSADGASTVELPKLAPSPTSEPGVDTYTDGKQSFAKSGGQGTPAVIRFARGRMAFQDCAIAQN